MMAYTPSFDGGCLCGGVRYTYAGRLGEDGAATVCHCSQCRKAQGYASAVVPIATASLKIVSGAGLIREFESSAGKKRAFCSVCGSPLYSRRDGQPQILRLRLGSLDQPAETLTIDAHIFVEGAPRWAEPGDAPRYPGLEPGRA